MGRVQDKVALVTGGASGVGRSTVELLLQEGAFVAISDINAEAGQAFADECGERAMFVRHDVASEADWSAAIDAVQERFGQQGIEAMKERGGSIVNMASVSSWLPIEGYAGYSATKAAVASLTRSAALYCRNNGLPVRLNSLHPDGIYTPMMQASTPGVPAKFLLFDAKKNPKGRAAMPEHIAKVLMFLASDDSQAINGAEIRADSGILGMGL